MNTIRNDKKSPANWPQGETTALDRDAAEGDLLFKHEIDQDRADCGDRSQRNWNQPDNAVADNLVLKQPHAFDLSVFLSRSIIKASSGHNDSIDTCPLVIS